MPNATHITAARAAHPSERNRSRAPRATLIATVAAALSVASVLAQAPSQAPLPHAPPRPEPATLRPFKQPIPSAAYFFEMLPVPGSPDGTINPFYMSKTEITWEAFDVFIYRLDEPESDRDAPPPEGADAISRPTKPYLPPDRGFGHDGYAAISLSYRNAKAFCEWLSKKSGRRYRLPTEPEWEHACRAGAGKESDAALAASIADTAWFKSNAGEKPHPVAAKKPNALGLCDMLGNVAEWVTGRDGTHVTKGGSYQDAADALRPDARQPYDPAWNASDPQVPKSKWWLANGPFVGFRVVCELEPQPGIPEMPQNPTSLPRSPPASPPRSPPDPPSPAPR